MEQVPGLAIQRIPANDVQAGSLNRFIPIPTARRGKSNAMAPFIPNACAVQVAVVADLGVQEKGQKQTEEEGYSFHLNRKLFIPKEKNKRRCDTSRLFLGRLWVGVGLEDQAGEGERDFCMIRSVGEASRNNTRSFYRLGKIF